MSKPTGRDFIEPKDAHPNDTAKVVVLLHPLFLNHRVMWYMSRVFKSLGYSVVMFDYDSRRYSTEVIDQLHLQIQTLCTHTDQIYLVGHSMGGLIARHYMQRYQPLLSGLGLKDTCVVTLGTPHYGSHLGRWIEEKFIIKGVLGSAGDAGIVAHIEPWNECVALGCIAGVAKIGPNMVANHFHKNKKPSDGTVFQEEAILTNCTDSMVIECAHTRLVYSKQAVVLCDQFIKNRKFEG